jgi:serine/threonine-protein kinase
MNAGDALKLSADIVLVPCADLDDQLRGRFTFAAGDVTLTHLHGRVHSQVIDGNTAALLALFREPRTIVDAVLESSRALGKEPRAWLDEQMPILDRFVHSRVLIPAGSDDDGAVRPRYDSGAAVAGWKVVRCISLFEDTEVYHLRNGDAAAALKIARRAGPALQPLFENEAEILRHLDGSGIAPRLLDAGMHEERPYLVMEWIDGVDSTVAAAQNRHDRALLLDLCASIAGAYAALHARGVLHSDVHPRNVLAGRRVVLLDFGYSRFQDRPARVGRAGVPAFYEPEHLLAHLRGGSAPSSAAGEQYALAALLYFLITGDHYLDFRFDREEMDRQMVSDPPLPFARRGIAPWPEVESILFRALQKDPARRHASVAAMAALLARARDGAARDALSTPLSAEAHAVLDRTLRSFARGGAMFASGYPSAPTASIYWGCAGAAVGLLRIAEARGDAALLALADVWRSRAAALLGTADAFYNDGRLSREFAGDVSPFHTEAGVHVAAAMIAAARSDSVAQGRAVNDFLRTSNEPCAEIDLTLGRSGSLLAAALLLDLTGDADDAAALRGFGAETMRAVWNELDDRAPLQVSPEGTNLGMAHGWAGYLYAALRWCSSSGHPLPPRLAERLDEYATLSRPAGRGACWPMQAGKLPVMPGWCQGSAGRVFLFVLAHRLLGDERWLQIAEACAWHTWEDERFGPNLCCGSAGRAYALLHVYQHTGAREWLSRARRMANHAAAAIASKPDHANSLWRGELGVAVLIADLASPESARMPFFE